MAIFSRNIDTYLSAKRLNKSPANNSRRGKDTVFKGAESCTYTNLELMLDMHPETLQAVAKYIIYLITP